jgi:hypothetical protein
MSETIVLTDIVANIVTVISGLTKHNGYDYDIGTINDPANADPSYPTIEIMYGNENSLPPPLSHFRFSEAEINIKIRAKLESVQDVPAYAINPEANKVLTDIKKLFAVNLGALSLDNTTATIEYKSSSRELTKSGDAFVPGILNSVWKVTYQS